MSQLLKDSVNKIDRFIDEAQISLEYGCGFPAMLTIFAVVFAISESIYTHKKRGRMSDASLMSLFIEKMNDKEWFIKTNDTNVTDDDLCKILIGVRDGLTHQISLPIGVVLVPDLSFISSSYMEDYDYIIAVYELILSVRQTLADIVSDKNNSTCCIDGKFHNVYPPRGVAGQVPIIKTDGTITSGSAT